MSNITSRINTIAFAKSMSNPFVLFAVYTIFALFLTYPMILNIFDATTGGDTFIGMWFLWWVPHSVFVLHSTPYYSNFVFYPFYSDLATAASLVPLQGLLLAPITLMNPILAYNIFTIMGFSLSGVSAFYLTKRFTNNIFASFVAGFIFTFSPNHFSHATGHWHMQYIAWVPLFILALFRLKDEPNWKNSILLIVSIALTVYTADLQFLLYYVTILAFFLVFYLFKSRQKILNKKFIVFTILGLAISFLVILPPIYPLISGNLEGGIESRKPELQEFIAYSMDAYSFITPSMSNPFIGNLFAQNYSAFSGNASENTGYLGISVIILSIIGIITYKKKSLFWLLGSIFFAILSLGPVLHIMGKTALIVSKSNPLGYIPLPSVAYYFIPFLDLIRAISRIEVVLMLTISVLSAYGITSIFLKLERRRLLKILIGVAILGIIIFEYCPTPYPLDYTNTKVPEFYQNIKNKTDGAILSLPTKVPNTVKPEMYLFYASTAQKPLIGGEISRVPMTVENVPYAIPIAYQTEFTSDNTLSKVKLMKYEQDGNLCSMATLNAKYIVLHKADLQTKLEPVESYLDQSGFKKVFSNDQIIGYTVPENQKCITLYLGDGWFNLEKVDQDNIGAWLTKKGELVIISPEKTTASLSFKARNSIESNSIIIEKNGVQIYESSLDLQTFQDVRIDKLSLDKGINILTFKSQKGCIVPAKVPEINNGDTRCLSIFTYDYRIIS